jgi:Raf kinase inhibitor-like YbhB/YbcL family protein
MKTVFTGTWVTLALAGLCVGAADAQNAPGSSGPPVLARELVPARADGRLLVTSPAFKSGAALDDKYTQNGDNMSPPLSWTKGPAGTQAFAVLAEDAGVDRKEPIVHWVVYNIPSTRVSLASEFPADATLGNGTMQGKNVRGTVGYVGPKPPAGQTHPYHFQVFALSQRLNVDPAKADRDAVVTAMRGKVLASGDIVANYTGK